MRKKIFYKKLPAMTYLPSQETESERIWREHLEINKEEIRKMMEVNDLKYEEMSRKTRIRWFLGLL